VVTLPLVLLAIPSVIIGAIAIEPMLFGDSSSGFKDVIFVGEPSRDGRTGKSSTAGCHGDALADDAAAVAGDGRCGAVVVLLHEAPGHPGGHQATFLRSTSCWTTSTTWTRSTRRLRRGARLLGTGLWKGGDQA
jgi:NADH-quinone oxidoreductase subunit L